MFLTEHAVEGLVEPEGTLTDRKMEQIQVSQPFEISAEADEQTEPLNLFMYVQAEDIKQHVTVAYTQNNKIGQFESCNAANINSICLPTDVKGPFEIEINKCEHCKDFTNMVFVSGVVQKKVVKGKLVT